ncbi:hypothetical protein ACFQ4C_03680 [Larkinella insperata]|uniref:Uncharacterized protein n=1 Tax=Larkinella insperata TaxID=332158 RepID=A0ABW3QF47_9BACT|nr:hypothetical protein [Larkinella insperata]
MAKYAKNPPYRLDKSKALVWTLIMLLAVGFLFAWYFLLSWLIHLM